MLKRSRSWFGLQSRQTYLSNAWEPWCLWARTKQPLYVAWNLIQTAPREGSCLVQDDSIKRPTPSRWFSLLHTAPSRRVISQSPHSCVQEAKNWCMHVKHGLFRAYLIAMPNHAAQIHFKVFGCSRNQALHMQNIAQRAWLPGYGFHLHFSWAWLAWCSTEFLNAAINIWLILLSDISIF